MLTAGQVQQFKAQGFLLGSKVLSDDQLEVLRQEMQRVIDEHDRPAQGGRAPVLCRNLARPEAPVWQIVNIWMASDAFRELIYHPTVTEEIAQLTAAKELRIWHDQIQYKPAGVGGVNMWHQDSPYWPILRPMIQVTAWVALDDVDEANGCMSMVPGSHLWGDAIEAIHQIKEFSAVPATYQGHEVRVQLCPVPKGHVHYHHGLTWHGSGANRSGRPRRAIALHYMTEQTRYHAAGNHVMKPYVEVADGQVMRGRAFPRVWPAPVEEACPKELVEVV